MKTVIVTGGAGYIGSHTAKALAAAGYNPVVVDNLSRGFEWAVQWGPLEKVDLEDRDGLRRVFESRKPEAVLHFAAYAYVGESVQDPYLYYRNNVNGTLTLLEVLREFACDKLVFSSTCATYGIPEQLPITEETPQNPVNPYGASKLMVERILQDAEVGCGLRSVALRYFNAAGGDPEGEIGEAHDPETHLLPLAIAAASGEGPRLKVFGSDYDTPDGSCVRDYIHVCDLADAHVRALKWLEAGGSSEQFNLGNGTGFSVLEIIEAVGKVTGHQVPYDLAPRRAGDPPILIADTSKVRRELGWIPQYSDVTKQISDAWLWYKKRMAEATL